MRDVSQQKVKVLKKGKRKTPSELRAEYRRVCISQIRLAAQMFPDEARKIFSEMLNGAT